LTFALFVEKAYPPPGRHLPTPVDKNESVNVA
jgi:hypothetical protein